MTTRKSSEDNDMEEKRMLELADRLVELREAKAVAEAQLTAINGDIENVQAQLISVMTEQECSGFKRGNKNFSLVVTALPSPVVECKAELWEVMKAKGFEGLFTINSRTLQSTIKELIEANDGMLPDWLDGLIRVAEKATVRVTKSTK